MSMRAIALIIVVVVAVLFIVYLITGRKKSKKKAYIEDLKIRFMNLQSSSKAINEAYLKESLEYLLYSAPKVKEIDQIQVGLLDILAKHKDAGKISKDGFYDKAFEAITRK